MISSFYRAQIRFRAAAGGLLCPLFLGACATYKAQPLIPENELTFLRQTASLNALRIERVTPGESSTPASVVFDPTDGLDEAELVAVVLTVNPSLRAKRLEIGEAQALLISAGIWPNPELEAFVRPGIGGASSTGLGLDLLFTLFRPDERSAKQALAEARVEEIRAEIAAEEVRVVADVRRARVEVLAEGQKVLLLEQEAALRDEALNLIRRHRDLGEATEIAVALIELDRTGIHRALREARASLDRGRRSLNQLVGVPPTYELPLSVGDQAFPFKIYPDLGDEELDRRVLAGRLDLRARSSAYQVQEEELRLAIARQYPSLRLGPSFEKDVEGSKGLGIGGSIELPLFDRNQGEIAEKMAARDRARADYVALLHELRARAFDARASLRRAQDEVEFQQREILPLLERSETLFEAAFRSRDLTIFEWITTRSRAVQTRGELLDALVRYAASVVELETSTGLSLAGFAGQKEEKQ